GLITVSAFVASTLLLILGTVWATLLALAFALAPAKDNVSPLDAVSVAGALGLTCAIFCSFASSSDMAAWAFMHPAGGIQAALILGNPFWRDAFMGHYRLPLANEHAHALMLSSLLSVASTIGWIAILLRACARKIDSPDRPLLSKAQ